MKNWKETIVSSDKTIMDAINILEDIGSRIVLVCENQTKLIGTVSDGDIRRALSKSLDLNLPIKAIVNKNPMTLGKRVSAAEFIKIYEKEGILAIPILSKDGNVIDLQTLERGKKSYENYIFLMAGGFGTRLHPLTLKTPKPLLKINEKSIIELIIDNFLNYGFNNFIVSTHYKSSQIKKFIKSLSKEGLNITLIEEIKPLGTAGSLGLIPKDLTNLPIILMNADLLTEINFPEMLHFHNSNNFELTVAVREFEYQLPFGEVKIDSSRIRALREKPIYKHHVSAGIYILNKSIYTSVSGDEYLDITDLISKNVNAVEIGGFPIHESWIDIGRHDDLEKARKSLK